MRGGLRWARRVRVSRRQLWLAAFVSGGVSALILATAFGQVNWQATALAALHDRAAQSPGATSGAVGSAGSLPSGGPGSLGGSLPSAPPTPATTTVTSPASGGSSGTATTGSSGGSTQKTSTTPSSPGTTPKTKPKTKSPVKHVFVISLATNSYADAFGASSGASYLNGTLRPEGELLTGYQTLTGVPLADDLALIGGQPSNPDTESNCPNYDDFPAGRAPNKRGVIGGTGCVYPDAALTLGDQMDGAALPWRGFVDGMTAPCVHPNANAADSADPAGYDPRENPFVFFHSLLDLGDCQEYDLPLSGLSKAVSGKPGRVPSLVYVSADPCDGGAGGCSSSSTTTTTTPTTTTTTTSSTTTTGSTSPATPAPDPTVAAGDAFLKKIVPEILGSKAYRKAGALFIVFSGTSSAQAGSATGALVLSPFLRAGSSSSQKTNAYGVLRTVEHVFGLSPLAMARGVKPIQLIKR